MMRGENILVPLLDIYNKISIQQYKTDMGFKSLVEGVHENLFVIPEYQRKYRWDKQQVEELAASLIRDLPIPPIYTFRNEDGQLEILDGQQRVMSLYFYFIGKFFKSSKESVFDYSDLDIEHSKNFEEALETKYHNIVPTKFFMRLDNQEYDISYATLPVALKRKIDYRTISVIEIKTSEIEKRDVTLHKIFTNLNNGGKRLSDQELRNGIYPCSFSRMISTVNRTNKKWRELYGRIDEQCRDMELLYRFASMKKYVEYDGKNFKIYDYNNSIEKLIDHFTEAAFGFSEEEVEEYRITLERFISLMDISKKYFKKKTLLEGFFVVWEKTDLGDCILTDDLCEKILTDNIIAETRKGGTITPTNTNKRWKRIYEILSENVG